MSDQRRHLLGISGGKDSIYVTHQLKHKYGINPLTVTVRPEPEIDLSDSNLKPFTYSGFDHIHITPNADEIRELNKFGVIEKGFPYYGWLTAIHTTILRVATAFDIRLIIYGEDGEVEYGGSDGTKNRLSYDAAYQKRIYLESDVLIREL